MEKHGEKIHVDKLIHARWVIKIHEIILLDIFFQVIPVVPEDTYYENFTVVVHEGKILDLLPIPEAKHLYVAQSEVDLSKEHVVLPGLINLHCHTPMSMLRGLAEDTVNLMDWLMVNSDLSIFSLYIDAALHVANGS
jgi:hypothetical protein